MISLLKRAVAGAAKPVMRGISDAQTGSLERIGLMAAASLGGGALSYATGGGFFQGAGAGLLAGMGASQLSKMSGKAFTQNTGIYPKAQAFANGSLGDYVGKDAAAGFSTGMQRIGAFTASKGSRRYAFGAGAMLGGMMFGGNRSHARGFNGERGNRFGR